MKKSNSLKGIEELVITETASGEVFLKEMEGQLWWRVPTDNAPVDLERLREDCKAICSRTNSASYVEYIGVHDTSDVLLKDERYGRFVGGYPLGRFDAGTSKLEIDTWLAGPDNLRLFGMEDRIAELPEVVAQFHTEATHILRKLMAEANELKNRGDKGGWFFRAGIADSIQDVRFNGLMFQFESNTYAWFKKNVWETLAVLCQLVHPDTPQNALWLYIAAYEFGDVYLPIPDDIIEGVKDDPWLCLAVSKHRDKELDAGCASDDGRQVAEPCRN